MNRYALAPLAFALALAGCASLEPAVPQAQPGTPPAWPIPAATGGTPAAEVGWRDFFADDGLEALIALALANNRDLRVAVLNVERARALYRVQRSERLPAIGAGASLQRSGGRDLPTTDLYSASVGIADFELDLFGRVRNLSESALQQYFAREESRRAAQLSLVAELANTWLTLAADREQLRVSQASLATHEQSYALSSKRYELGAVSRLDLAQARTQVESARADAARFAGFVAQDTNALALLVGAPVDAALLPKGFGAPVAGIPAVPEGVPSEVLLRRPDVIAAEHQMRAANANIGAARAAFFPSIRLTGSAGTASDELSGLFRGGSFVWSVLPSVSLPIFSAGRLQSSLEVAQVDRDIALAQYERAIQSGFREVADALALSRTLAGQRAAQEELVAAATQAQELSKARYEAGRDSFLVLLDAQRTLYAAQQALVATRLAEQANRVTLYKALGGGWKERS